jgi:uncharacterized protein with GYD domain
MPPCAGRAACSAAAVRLRRVGTILHPFSAAQAHEETIGRDFSGPIAAAVRPHRVAIWGKFINFYFTTGDSDFLLISEANDAESIIAALMAAAAAGTISDVTTARAWTGAEFKAIADKASKAASAYRGPGKRK